MTPSLHQSGPIRAPRSVVCIGTFDGVHLGHQALIAHARVIARSSEQPGTRVVAMVFKPNPLEVLRPQAAPPRLSMFERRRHWLLAAGADEVVRLEPSPALLSLSPEQFIRQTVQHHHPIAFVEGPDFRFGHNRAGDLTTLTELGRTMGFKVEVVPPVSLALTDHQYVPARSTVVRWLLGLGRVRDAALLLGRPYELAGTVVRGDRRGRTIGFPTANLETSTMIPADGVYAAVAHLPDGRVLPAAVSIGSKPTFGTHARAVEAFVLDPEPSRPHVMTSWAPLEGLAEYGWPLRLEMLAWVREQVKFHGLPALLSQLNRDCERVRAIVGHPAAALAPGKLSSPTSFTAFSTRAPASTSRDLHA